MTPQEWLSSVSRDGSIPLSDSSRSVLSHFVSLDTETLWSVLGLLGACFSDLGKAGHIASLPPNMDPQMADGIFMHLSSMMTAAIEQSKMPGSEPSDLPVFAPTIPQGGP